MIRIATFNANGIRAAVRRGFGEWLAARDCDVVAIQEMRCPVADLPELPGYHLAYDAGMLPGRNGVAILSKAPPLDVRPGIGRRAFDHEGRYLEVDLDVDGRVQSVRPAVASETARRRRYDQEGCPARM